MLDFPKTENKKRTNESDILRELNSLLAIYGDFEPKEFISKFVPLIKKTFGELFLIEDHYTFQDLISRIREFDREGEIFLKKSLIWMRKKMI